MRFSVSPVNGGIYQFYVDYLTQWRVPNDLTYCYKQVMIASNDARLHQS